jgi:transcriptional regulator with XRE-family HTH domain
MYIARPTSGKQLQTGRDRSRNHRREQYAVTDLDRLTRFQRKSYRDGYLQSHVRGGIAYQIQALRDQLGLTQTDFAARVGKPQSVISRLENTEYGKVTVQTLLDIACSLDVALLVLFVSYPEFLERTQDMTAAGLQVPTIHQSVRAAGLGQALQPVSQQSVSPASGLGARSIPNNVIPLATTPKQGGDQVDLGAQLASSFKRMAAE